MIRERLLQGDPDKMNSELPLEEQVALLSYDPKWEFPRNQLVLGIIISYKVIIQLSFMQGTIIRKTTGIWTVWCCS